MIHSHHEGRNLLLWLMQMQMQMRKGTTLFDGLLGNFWTEILMDTFGSWLKYQIFHPKKKNVSIKFRHFFFFFF